MSNRCSHVNKLYELQEQIEWLIKITHYEKLHHQKELAYEQYAKAVDLLTGAFDEIEPAYEHSKQYYENYGCEEDEVKLIIEEAKRLSMPQLATELADATRYEHFHSRRHSIFEHVYRARRRHPHNMFTERTAHRRWV